ncbi:MAG: hypothetical protein IID14_09755 [Candidatus Marinimicrobia bacterium]|nr:hypothetical protein [Candidatus Neomarinimicrobiota bacterium]
MGDGGDLRQVLRYDSGARGFKKAAIFLGVLAGGLLIFGIGFLWQTWRQLP